LESELVSSVLSPVDNVEARNRKGIRGRVSSNISVVLPEGNTLGSSSSLGSSKRN